MCACPLHVVPRRSEGVRERGIRGGMVSEVTKNASEVSGDSWAAVPERERERGLSPPRLGDGNTDRGKPCKASPRDDLTFYISHALSCL